MDTQSINDQLELLRLKELFMSDIDIRSKMAMLICPFHVELPKIHRIFTVCSLTSRAAPKNTQEAAPKIPYIHG